MKKGKTMAHPKQLPGHHIPLGPDTRKMIMKPAPFHAVTESNKKSSRAKHHFRAPALFGGLCFLFTAALLVSAAQPPATAPSENGGEAADFNPPESAVDLAGQNSSKKQEQVLKARRTRELERLAKQNFKRGGMRLTEARKNINELINLSPYSPEYHLALALELKQEGREEEAFNKLNDVLELHGPKQIVYLLMAEYYEGKGVRDKTLEVLQKASENGMKIMKAVSRIDSLKHLRNDSRFIEMALRLERVELRSLKYSEDYFQEHLDPFTPSAKWRIESKDVAKSGAKKESFKPWTNKEEADLLFSAKRVVNTINRLLNAASPDEEKIAQQYEELKQIIAQKDKIRIPRLKREMTIIVEKVSEIETRIENIRLRIHYKKAREKLAEMKEAFAQTDYNAVKVFHTQIKTMAEAIKKEGKAFTPLADHIIKIADSWFKRALIRLEFAEKNLHINGIITNTESNEAENHETGNFVIINNKLIKEGSEFENLLIKDVERNRVTFFYKGETIGMVFRRY